MIDPARLTELRVLGFTVVEDVLDLTQAHAMRDFVVEKTFSIGVEHRHRGTARHLANLVTLDPMFLPAIDHEEVLPYIEAVMGKNLILGSLNARVVRPGEGEQTLHSDVPIAMHRYGDDPPLMMNTVWALSDLNPQNGGTRLVPGSHQSHLFEPPAGLELPHEMQPTIRAGSVVIFHGQTWHGGGTNHTDELRTAMFGHYRNGEWLRFQCDPHDGFKTEWLEDMTSRQKELLRMTNGIDHRHGADFYER
ncbi:MAG: phytanoyl-CoA dioxygenase family protein [Gammaproteobacteria bacterium]|nr:phytanoyl-CoA dioxygenase family protein [Gammaproteobacteria bacterium]